MVESLETYGLYHLYFLPVAAWAKISWARLLLEVVSRCWGDVYVSFPGHREDRLGLTSGIDGNSSLTLISSGKSTREGGHGDGRFSCISPQEDWPLSPLFSPLWSSTSQGKLTVRYIYLSSAVNVTRILTLACAGLASFYTSTICLPSLLSTPRLIDALPRPLDGSRKLLPRFFSCSEGKRFTIPFPRDKVLHRRLELQYGGITLGSWYLLGPCGWPIWLGRSMVGTS